MPEATQPFSSSEAIRYGWQKTTSNLKPFLILGAIGAVLALFQQAFSTPGDNGLFRALLSLILSVLQTALGLVYVRVALALNDGLPPPDFARWADLVADFFTYLLTSILYSLIVAVGFALLIVPGVIWGLKFGFATFLVVDQKLNPMDALRESSRLTNGVKGTLFAFALLLLGVNILGAIALGIGLIVTVPTSIIAAAYVLRRLQARVALQVRPAPPTGIPEPLPSH